MLFLDLINQFLVTININSMALIIQFKGRLLISVVGSKIENRFLITFNLFFMLIVLFVFFAYLEIG